MVCSTEYGCRTGITLVSASTAYIFTIFIVMSGWFLIDSAIVQYHRKKKVIEFKKKNQINTCKLSYLLTYLLTVLKIHHVYSTLKHGFVGLPMFLACVKINKTE